MNTLIEMFVNIIKFSREIEMIKQTINDKIEFEPYAVFTRIDRKNWGYIDINDIRGFIQENGGKEDNLDLLIEYYDRNFDGRLNYGEFLNFILPYHNFLRSLTSQKKTLKIPPNEYLTDDLEKLVTELFMLEAYMFNIINLNKLNIFENKHDIISIYQNLDSNKDGVICFGDIDLLLRKYELIFLEEEVNYLVRLFDEDLSNDWNWNEFLFMILPSRLTYEYDIDYLKNLEFKYNSLFSNSKPRKDLRSQTASTAGTNFSSIYNTAFGNKLSGVKYTEYEFASDLYKIMYNEKQLENIKVKLSYDEDFHLVSLFNHLDSKKKKTIDLIEFTKGMEYFDVNTDKIYLIFQYMNINILNFSNFVEIMIPKNKHEGLMLVNRKPNKLPSFSNSTRKLIRDFFNGYIENLFFISNFMERVKLDINEVFNFLDFYKNGFITIQEFRKIMIKYNYDVTNDELILLMDRFDKNKDGKISLAEFCYDI